MWLLLNLGMFGYRILWCLGEGPGIEEQIEGDSFTRWALIFLFSG